MPKLTLFPDTEPDYFVEWLRDYTVERMYEGFYPIDPRDTELVGKLEGVQGHDSQIHLLNQSPLWWDKKSPWTARTIIFEASTNVVRFDRRPPETPVSRMELLYGTGEQFLESSEGTATVTSTSFSLGEVLRFHLTRRSPGRLQVDVEWRHFTLAGYMAGLLTALAEAYPETRPTIARYPEAEGLAVDEVQQGGEPREPSGFKLSTSKEQVVRLSVKLPTRGQYLLRWRDTWDELYRNRQQNKTKKEILKWLKDHCPRLLYSEDTLDKILEAGRLGMLDNIKVEANPD